MPILEQLNIRLSGRLVVCSGEPPRGSSYESLFTKTPASYRQIVLQNRWLNGDRLHFQHYAEALSSPKESIVVLAEESPRSVSLPLLLRKASNRGFPTILWGHFSSNNRPLGSTDIRDRYRIRMAKNAGALVTYTAEIAEQLSRVVTPEKVFVAQNTLDTKTLFRFQRELDAEGRAAVRGRLGLPEGLVLLFLGRLIREKGTALLVDTIRALGRPDTLLLVIGDGPERELICDEAGKAGVETRFLGAIPDFEKSSPYIYASDVLLNPGYVGLSVIHAFALGVPVVAPMPPDASRFHSPEWSHIRTRINGVLATDSSARSLAQAVSEILADQTTYSANARDYALEHLSVDQMLDGLEAAIRYVSTPSSGDSPTGQNPNRDV
ncbi:MAG: hypothetical protein BMS9Abin05_2363 [Rhodothermia bacterium]|nr:MAG: hypothetical protein BMS9Abin05_2363 [Rhodothermia bacterium]